MNVIRPTDINTSGSFSRASSKQCIGADGLLHTVPVDVPAFQYDATDLTKAPVALLELAATNFVLYSELRSGAPYEIFDASVTDNGVVASLGPDGVSGVRKFTVIGANTNSVIRFGDSTSGTSGTVYAGSVYARCPDGASRTIELDCNDGTTISKTLNGEWVRVSAVAFPTATYRFLDLKFINDGYYEIFGAQIEVGKVTSFISTGASTVTRAADVITGTGLIWSSAPEEAPAAYNSGAAYSAYDRVSTAGSAGLLTVYESLVSSNTGHTPASSPTFWKNVGTTYQLYSSGATYAIGDTVIDQINHKVYRSVVNANMGQSLLDPLKWFDDGATNRWSAFDDVVGTSAQQPNSLQMLIVSGAIDSIGILNINGSSLSVTMTDQISMATVASRTTNLTNDPTIRDYDAYFFEEVELLSDIYIDEFPPYYSGVLAISLIGPDTVSIGVMKMGNTFNLGLSQYGLRLGFISYTKKTVDSDGRASVTKGAISRRMTVTTMIENSALDKTYKVMGALDGVPTIWVGAGNNFASAIQFAFSKEFEVEIAYPVNSLCSHQLEGLI